MSFIIMPHLSDSALDASRVVSDSLLGQALARCRRHEFLVSVFSTQQIRRRGQNRPSRPKKEPPQVRRLKSTGRHLQSGWGPLVILYTRITYRASWRSIFKERLSAPILGRFSLTPCDNCVLFEGAFATLSPPLCESAATRTLCTGLARTRGTR